MFKVSVIIPVYNAKYYLRRCLDSVCNQTLKDIEIICIDDCSNDNSYEILQEYANKYSNLKAIHLEKNGGESIARNKGLAIATGEYLAFVDNDDEIDLDFYEKLYTKAKEENADIAKGETREIGYNGEINFGSINKEIRENNYNLLYFTHHWWTAIYKHSIIKENAINFIEGYPLGGDVLFLNEFLLKARSITLVDNALYHYYRREDSGDSKMLPFSTIKSVLDIINKIFNNVYTSCSLEDKGVIYIFVWCMRNTLRYVNKCNTEENIKFCVDNLFAIYEKVVDKQDIINLFTTNYEIEAKMLVNNHKEEMIAYFRDNKNPQKKMLAKLRYNTKQGKAHA